MNEATVATTPATTTPTKAAPKKAPAKKDAKKAPAKKPAPKKASKKPAAKKGDAAVTGPAILKEYAKQYTRDSEHKTSGGNVSVHCGDDVAKKLLGKSLEDCYKLAAKTCECTEKELRDKYGKLNVGMQRMNLGNRMRGVLNAK